MAQVLRSANIAQTLRAVNAKQGSLEVAPAAVSPSAAAVATPHTQSAQKLNHSAARRTLHQQHRAALDLQANALPVTETSSLVFVKDLLTTSFGSLAFLRGLFGDENFDNDTLYPNGEEPVDRGAGSTDKGPSGTPKKPIPVKKLKRGISVEVDTILDWINLGVFDALQKKYLQKIIFSIFTDPANDVDAVEVYTFSFSYTPDSVKMDFVSNYDTDGYATLSEKSKSLTDVQDAKKNLYNLVRRFILMTQKLGTLPDSRHLSMRLLYTPETPPAYQPPQFVDCTDTPEASLILNSVTADAKVYTIDKSEIGQYSLSMKIVSKPNAADSKRTQDGSNAQQNYPPTNNSTSHAAASPRPADSGSRSSSGISQEDQPPYKDKRITQLRQREITTSSGSQIEVAQGLHKMFSPDAVEEISATQPYHDDDQTSTLAEVDLQNDVDYNEGRNDADEVLAGYPEDPYVVSPAPDRENHALHDSAENNAADLGVTNSCICGQHDDTSFPKVKCKRCHSSSHLSCEGYRSPADPRLSSFELCLTCQLKKECQVQAQDDGPAAAALFAERLPEVRAVAVRRKCYAYICNHVMDIYRSRRRKKTSPMLDVFETEIGARGAGHALPPSQLLETVCRELHMSLKELEELFEKAFTREDMMFLIGSKVASNSGTDGGSDVQRVRRLTQSRRRLPALDYQYFSPGLVLRKLDQPVSSFLTNVSSHPEVDSNASDDDEEPALQSSKKRGARKTPTGKGASRAASAKVTKAASGAAVRRSRK